MYPMPFASPLANIPKASGNFPISKCIQFDQPAGSVVGVAWRALNATLATHENNWQLIISVNLHVWPGCKGSYPPFWLKLRLLLCDFKEIALGFLRDIKGDVSTTKSHRRCFDLVVCGFGQSYLFIETCTNMLRLLLLPLFLFTLSMAMAQTFQYSRGWTNGKRAPTAALLTNGHNLGVLDLYDMQDKPSDLKLERCLLQLQHIVGNSMLQRSFANALAYNANRPDTEAETRGLNNHGRSGANNNINDNSLYPNSNHHQSNELFEALAATGADSVEPNDYVKH